MKPIRFKTDKINEPKSDYLKRKNKLDKAITRLMRIKKKQKCQY